MSMMPDGNTGIGRNDDEKFMQLLESGFNDKDMDPGTMFPSGRYDPIYTHPVDYNVYLMAHDTNLASLKAKSKTANDISDDVAFNKLPAKKLGDVMRIYNHAVSNIQDQRKKEEFVMSAKPILDYMYQSKPVTLAHVVYLEKSLMYMMDDFIGYDKSDGVILRCDKGDGKFVGFIFIKCQYKIRMVPFVDTKFHYILKDQEINEASFRVTPRDKSTLVFRNLQEESARKRLAEMARSLTIVDGDDRDTFQSLFGGIEKGPLHAYSVKKLF